MKTVVDVKRMRQVIFSLGGIILIFMCACSKKQFVYSHVSLRPSENLAVLERSKNSLDNQGKALLEGKSDLPIKSVLNGKGYVVEIYTPLNSQALAFARARSNAGAELTIKGPNVVELDVKAGVRQVSGYRYQLNVSSGTPSGEWDIAIVDGQTPIGTQQIAYDIINRGHKFEIDTW